MSLFAKLIIPLLDFNLNKSDFKPETGFVGCYTKDYDKPTDQECIYLVYDASMYNANTIYRWNKFSKLTTVKNIETRYFNGKPYIVYTFIIKHTEHNLYCGFIALDSYQKLRILDFWGNDQEVQYEVLKCTARSIKSDYPLPLKDYQLSVFEMFQNQKRGGLTIETSP